MPKAHSKTPTTEKLFSAENCCCLIDRLEQRPSSVSEGTGKCTRTNSMVRKVAWSLLPVATVATVVVATVVVTEYE